MAKLILGKTPVSFKHTVKFPMLDGTTGEIAVTYKYRTSTEYGKFMDKIMADAGVEKTDDGEKFSMEALMAKTSWKNANYLLQAVLGWDIEADLNATSAQQLVDEVPAAAIAIMEAYRAAIMEGRLGN